MATIYQQFDPRAGSFKTSLFPELKKFSFSPIPVDGLAFDAAVNEAVYWRFRAIRYGSGDLSVDIDWYADTATTGTVLWNAQVAAITPNTDTIDIEGKTLAAIYSLSASHLGTTGQREHRSTITIPPAGLDSLAAEDNVWIRVARDGATDTMVGDAILTMLTTRYSDT